VAKPLDRSHRVSRDETASRRSHGCGGLALIADDRRRILENLKVRADELEVMELLAQGLTDHEVARRLSVSAITVRRRVQRLCRSLGARSRLQAMAWVVRLGLIDPWRADGDPMAE
jgi:DNA-binding NarL/FixJ family response regulator